MTAGLRVAASAEQSAGDSEIREGSYGAGLPKTLLARTQLLDVGRLALVT